MAEAAVPNELFVSVIMTPTEYPRCFAGNTPIAKTITKCGMDRYVVSAIFGEFLAYNKINTLYIAGDYDSFATPFFDDLRNALLQDYEVGFYSTPTEYMDKPKRIVRICSEYEYLPTDPENHFTLRFLVKAGVHVYTHFSREDFAAYVAAGNTDDGPDRNMLCASPSGTVCLRLNYIDLTSCSKCFRPSLWRTHNIDPVYIFYPSFMQEIDEGCVAESLAMPKYLYSYHIDDYDIQMSDSD
ncbi:hypothetical protein [Barthadenovirus sternae]|nr:hypothetical protein [Tern adenovirus]UJZ92529.1 hypothetical protein [Tern atadenovirus 1]